MGNVSFAALGIRNYRRFSVGQGVSMAGTWMQTTGVSWLVLELTDSGTAVGLAVGLQVFPLLLLAPFAGVIIDRVQKRRMLMAVQPIMAVLALTLGVLTLTHIVAMWHVYALALLYGLCRCFEVPARQAFVGEIVGRELLRNAVALNSVIGNSARIVGPAIAGVIISTGGTGLCFILNAASYAVALVLQVRMDRSELFVQAPVARGPGQLREGLHYVWRTRLLRSTLAMMLVMGILVQQYPVVLPLLAQRTFDSGPEAFGYLASGLGVGAVLGGLVVAGRGKTGTRMLGSACLGIGLAIAVVAAMPNLQLAIAAMVLVGAGHVTVLATANSTVQMAASPSVQGRVMSLWAAVAIGSSALGAPIVGWLSDAAGVRAALALSSVAAIVTGAYGLFGRTQIQGYASQQVNDSDDLVPG